MSKEQNSRKRTRSNRRGGRNSKEEFQSKEETQQTRSIPAKEDNPRLSSLNDISWYSRNPKLLAAAASFSFPYRPGMQLPILRDGDIRANYSIPGVMALEWIPTIGQSSTATDPASLAAKEFYGVVRSRFSGTLSADAPDFMIYEVALANIFSYIATLKRIYRQISKYSPDNFLVPETLLRAEGIAADDIQYLISDRVHLWQVINELVNMTRRFRCPNVMDIMSRWYWMNDNVYTDTPSMNSQMYVFVQKGWYRFALINTPDNVPAGGLELLCPQWQRTSRGETLVKSMYNFGSSLIQSLAGSESAYTISGYLLRAFEGRPEFIVDEISQDEPFNPVYQEEVLTQIENSFTLPTFMDYSAMSQNALFNISQNPKTNALICHNKMQFNVSTTDEATYYSTLPTLQATLSIRSEMPTAADNTIASRLKAKIFNLTADTSTKTVSFNYITGTEVPLAWQFWGLNSSGSSFRQQYFQQLMVTGDDSGLSSLNIALQSMARVSAFDWCPLGWLVLVDATTTPNTYQAIVTGDIHNITILSDYDIQNLHKVCIYSEFNAFGIE